LQKDTLRFTESIYDCINEYTIIDLTQIMCKSIILHNG